eukprot:GHVN01074010.1.p1 GENE.GHVN01074010.1~~GHVN01074010.1.p1  ORF type:complete len:204 (-),score=25.19 GHVN01074010.1:471-1082(-)
MSVVLGRCSTWILKKARGHSLQFNQCAFPAHKECVFALGHAIHIDEKVVVSFTTSTPAVALKETATKVTVDYNCEGRITGNAHHLHEPPAAPVWKSPSAQSNKEAQREQEWRSLPGEFIDEPDPCDDCEEQTVGRQDLTSQPSRNLSELQILHGSNEDWGATSDGNGGDHSEVDDDYGPLEATVCISTSKECDIEQPEDYPLP